MKKHQTQPQVLGVILANTPGSRINYTDRCPKKLMGKPIVSHIIEHTSPQVTQLILNANGDPTRFENIDIPIVPDAINDHPEVLSGILTGMEWAQDHMPDCQWVASFGINSPLIPDNLVERLFAAIQTDQSDMAYVSCNGRSHPEFGLWPVELATDLRYALEEDGIKRIEKWCSLYNPSICSYLSDTVDCFSNTNLIHEIIGTGKDSGLH